MAQILYKERAKQIARLTYPDLLRRGKELAFKIAEAEFNQDRSISMASKEYITNKLELKLINNILDSRHS